MSWLLGVNVWFRFVLFLAGKIAVFSYYVCFNTMLLAVHLFYLNILLPIQLFRLARTPMFKSIEPIISLHSALYNSWCQKERRTKIASSRNLPSLPLREDQSQRVYLRKGLLHDSDIEKQSSSRSIRSSMYCIYF